MNTEVRWLNDKEQRLWRLMLAADRKIARAMEETLQVGSDLSTPEYSVLVELSEAGDCNLRLRDLCANLDWDRSRTSHQITRMERRGLVTKHRSEGDARGVVVKITEDGMQRLKAAAPAHVETIRRVVFDHLQLEDVGALQRFFQGVLDVKQPCPLHDVEDAG